MYFEMMVYAGVVTVLHLGSCVPPPSTSAVMLNKVGQIREVLWVNHTLDCNLLSFTAGIHCAHVNTSVLVGK